MLILPQPALHPQGTGSAVRQFDSIWQVRTSTRVFRCQICFKGGRVANLASCPGGCPVRYRVPSPGHAENVSFFFFERDGYWTESLPLIHMTMRMGNKHYHPLQTRFPHTHYTVHSVHHRTQNIQHTIPRHTLATTIKYHFSDPLQPTQPFSLPTTPPSPPTSSPTISPTPHRQSADPQRGTA